MRNDSDILTGRTRRRTGGAREERKANDREMQDITEQSWRRCLGFIRNNLDEKPFSTWFSPIRFGGIRGRQLVLKVPSHFFYEYIEEHFITVLRAAVAREFGEGMTIGYRIETDSTHNITQVEKDKAPAGAVQPRSRAGANEAPPFLSGLAGAAPQELDPQLNPDYTFENFIEGESNKLPRSVGMSIADSPDQMTFNPLFIFGPSGVGKTHLVNAVGVRIKEKYPAKRVLYTSAHLFLVQYTDSVRKNRFNDFINFYQSVEVLIIDDIQEISGDSKQKTQQAFFHIFNHLQQTRHQLVMTSDRPPMQLEGVEERLLTRFKWGLVAELEKPDAKLAKRILCDRIRRNGLKFPREVVDYIAENVTENIRDIEGVINAMLAYSIVYDRNVDMELAKRVVARAVKPERGPVSINEIVGLVSEYYGIPIKDICSKSRRQPVAQARQVSMYLAQKHTGLSYSKVGAEIGKRDHSTVLHSCNVIERRISSDKAFRREMENIEASLQ